MKENLTTCFKLGAEKALPTLASEELIPQVKYVNGVYLVKLKKMFVYPHTCNGGMEIYIYNIDIIYI